MAKSATAVVALAAVVAATGCSAGAPTSDSPGTRDAPAPTGSTSAGAAATSAASSSPGTDGRPALGPTTEAVPTRQDDIGTVTQGRTTTFRGEGDRAVSYHVGGGYAVVVDLYCGGCKGRLRLSTSDRRGGPWFEGPAPTRTVALENVMASDKHTTLVIRAAGKWTLRLSSWNDTPFLPGTRSGEGAAIVKIAGPSSGLRIRTTPRKGESMLLRLYEASGAGTRGASRVIGSDEPMNETVDLPTPALVAVNGRGSWSFEPTDTPSRSGSTETAR